MNNRFVIGDLVWVNTDSAGPSYRGAVGQIVDIDVVNDDGEVFDFKVKFFDGSIVLFFEDALIRC